VDKPTLRYTSPCKEVQRWANPHKPIQTYTSEDSKNPKIWVVDLRSLNKVVRPIWSFLGVVGNRWFLKNNWQEVETIINLDLKQPSLWYNRSMGGEVYLNFILLIKVRVADELKVLGIKI